MPECRANDQIILEKLDSFTSQNNLQHDSITEKIEALIVQTTKTNGRVSRLEGVRDKVIGGIIVANAIGIPMLIKYFSK